LVQHVEDAARQTIVRTVEDFRRPVPEDEAHWSYDARSPEEEAEYARDLELALNWARVLTGHENCGFCVMLASRGPVYETAQTAGRIRASPEFRAVNGRRWMNSYHPNCDCVVVPVYDYGNWAGRDQWQALEKWYNKVIHEGTWEDKDGNVHKGFKYNDDSHDAKNNVIAELDRVLREMEKNGESLPVADVRAMWRCTFAMVPKRVTFNQVSRRYAMPTDDSKKPWEDGEFDEEKAWTLIQSLRGDIRTLKADKEALISERDTAQAESAQR